MMFDNKTPLIAYVHIPFCRRRCSYCDFLSHDNEEARILRYIEVLRGEISLKSSWPCVKDRPVISIYFGGGTPSIIPPDSFAELMDALCQVFPMSADCEITVEVNPESASEAFLTRARQAGANRLSIGIQSFENNVLTTLGRIHTAEDAKRAYTRGREAGFENISTDLIFGCPGETFEQWQGSVISAIELGPKHVSTYSLSLEKDVPMYRRIESGDIPNIDEDLNADKFAYAIDALTQAGYEHYEISNFCKRGFHSRHNWHYWGNSEYLGLGCGAYSYLDGERFRNTEELNPYLLGESLDEKYDVEKTTPQMGLRDDIFFGLRRIRVGVDLNDLARRRGAELVSRLGAEVETLKEEGLLERRGNRVRLTRRGIFLADEVLMRLL